MEILVLTQSVNPIANVTGDTFANFRLISRTDGSVSYSTLLTVDGIPIENPITVANGALSAIHIHDARAGQNGPVLQDVIIDAGAAATNDNPVTDF